MVHKFLQQVFGENRRRNKSKDAIQEHVHLSLYSGIRLTKQRNNLILDGNEVLKNTEISSSRFILEMNDYSSRENSIDTADQRVANNCPFFLEALTNCQNQRRRKLRLEE
jgi:hypothetical protein